MKYFLIIIIVFFSCTDKKTESTKDDSNYNELLTDFPKPENFTPISLIKKLKTDNRLNSFSIVDEFPLNWVSLNDVKKLIPLISSKQTCKCLKNPFTSSMPTENSNVGGYAILFINSYRNKTKIELDAYKCVKTNDQDVDEILKWWKKFK